MESYKNILLKIIQTVLKFESKKNVLIHKTMEAFYSNLSCSCNEILLSKPVHTPKNTKT